ncbi:MAG: MFS transporter [Candidatus Reconcilbacillus cellulovorans]|uniref:MFS transporter n=1 Tax=Candidatus Reconcilbacillus cellulovorans TaxID=1906605 RepID=A0A2A6DXN1_9BACL|nr:MAG: MFS transporter [Candidatus Reconcilbacillus cellulovorans]
MKKPLVLIVFIVFLVFVGFGIVIPVMPDMVNSPSHLSWMLAIYSLISFLVSPAWGALSDRIGRRPVLMIGLAGFAFSFLLFGLAGDRLWQMYLSRILGGLFSGATTSCAVAYVADVSPEYHRTRNMGLVGMAIGLGFVFGPAIGGGLSVFGVEVPFYTAAGLTAATLALAWRQLPESLERSRLEQMPERTSRWAAFRGPVRMLYALSFVVSFSMAGLEATLFYFLENRIRAGSFEIGIVLTVSGLVGAFVQGGVVRKWIRHGDEWRAIAVGLVLSAAGFWLLLETGSLATAVLFTCVFGIGNALVRPCVMSLITLKSKAGQGTATGLNASMDSLGRIVGPLVGGYLYVRHADLPYALTGIVNLLSLGLVFGFLYMDRMAGRKAA